MYRQYNGQKEKKEKTIDLQITSQQKLKDWATRTNPTKTREELWKSKPFLLY